MTINVVLREPAVQIRYLDERIIPATILSGFDTKVVIGKVVGYLRLPWSDETEPVRFRVDVSDRVIEPCGRVEALLYIAPDLTLPPSTVQLDIHLSYQAFSDGVWQPTRLLDIPAIGCIIVQPRLSIGKQSFISFKDPEDDHLARQLQTYLQAVGIKGYLAKDDPQYGTSIWGEKLPAAIRQSHVLAVIWTAHTLSNPGNVQREIRLATEADIPTILIPEPRIALPEGYDPGCEYASLNLANPEQSLALLVEGIWRRVSQ